MSADATEALCRLLRIPDWAGEMNYDYIASGKLEDRIALAAALVPDAELATLRAEVERLREALSAAANGLEDVADLTWDKRHPDECKRACAEASERAAGYRDEARAALEPTP